jgi:hypothetical protein
MDRVPVNRTCRALVAAGVMAALAAAAAHPADGPAASSLPPAPAGLPAASPTPDEVAARDARLLEAMRRSRESLVWTDEVVFHDWRLQRRPGADACRVLDPADAVVAAGTDADCRREFARLTAAAGLPAVGDEVVILLHGLGEGRDSMKPLADHLRRSVDATVLCFGYASVTTDIDGHGRALARVVSALPRGPRVSFVGHSLGNLVVRRWMALADAADVARARRMVMLGPPNQGSDLARMAARVWGVAARAEGAARDLIVDWPNVATRLAVPACPFGIVAGGTGNDRGFSPLLEGDDDAVVRVAETRLEGAADFLIVPVHHAAMMRDPAVQRATAAFLETGRFDPADAAAAAHPTAVP